MTSSDKNLTATAVEYVKQHKKDIIQQFANDETYKAEQYPVSVFMAGSPGAGKTEEAKRLISLFEAGDAFKEKIVRIDPDDVRAMFSGYTGKNSDVFQYPATLAAEKIHDYVLTKNKNFIFDSTFSDYDKACGNIDRSIRHGRYVLIVYLYQEPLAAWKFTQVRETKEGRAIPREDFVNKLFGARDTVNQVKQKYGDDVTVWLIEKNFETGKIAIEPNITSVDNHLQIPYTKKQLIEKL